jgi:hypothetical protein
MEGNNIPGENEFLFHSTPYDNRNNVLDYKILLYNEIHDKYLLGNGEDTNGLYISASDPTAAPQTATFNDVFHSCNFIDPAIHIISCLNLNPSLSTPRAVYTLSDTGEALASYLQANRPSEGGDLDFQVIPDKLGGELVLFFRDTSKLERSKLDGSELVEFTGPTNFIGATVGKIVDIKNSDYFAMWTNVSPVI